MGWLIDPSEHTVFSYTPTEPVQFVEEPETMLIVPPFVETVQLTAGELFGWLKF